MVHAELVLVAHLSKPCNEVYYFSMHAVHKETSSTSKVRIVFDASAKTASGTLLNDHLLIGPTLHPTIIEILLRFRRLRVALTTDVSRMCRAVLPPEHQCDLHHFVWREDPQQHLKDYKMTGFMFGVSASPFAMIIATRQNAIDQQRKYPTVPQVVMDDFYIDNGLDGEK